MAVLFVCLIYIRLRSILLLFNRIHDECLFYAKYVLQKHYQFYRDNSLKTYYLCENYKDGKEVFYVYSTKTS